MAWSYKELIDSFMEEYEEYKNIYHQSHSEAVARAFDENYSEQSANDMEKAVLWVIGAELKLKQPRVYKIVKENYIRNLKLINFEKIKEHIKDGQLSEQEFEELYLRRNTVLEQIEELPIDICPIARWFYEEIISKINYLFENSNNLKETTYYTIEFFEREFDNTLCAKKVVYVTIAENLIRRKEPIPDYIKSEIQNRYFDNSKFELNEQEILDLSQRIDRLLKKLETS